MGRDLGPSCRKCRREGIKLMLRRYARVKPPSARWKSRRETCLPGQSRAFRRGQASEYGKARLRETQKVSCYYGLLG
mgnify:CR=1 FL=1